MPRLHFLNVNDGDCTLIQHGSGRVSMIDVCNASPHIEMPSEFSELLENIKSLRINASSGVGGNFGMKNYPTNPIEYMHTNSITSLFRFISTHPDMDHLDGIKAVFDSFHPAAFWDTNNIKEMPDFKEGRYREVDWLFYKYLRDSKPSFRRNYYAGNKLTYFKDDGISILAPTPVIVADANSAYESGRDDAFNDSSYVLLYRVGNFRILLAGDSHDVTWEHIIESYPDLVSNIDVLLAPHHGRDSGRDNEFLNILNPQLTLFGNCRAEHRTDAYRNRLTLTNNQCGNIILNLDHSQQLSVYCENDVFARAFTDTAYSEEMKAYRLGYLNSRIAANA